MCLVCADIYILIFTFQHSLFGSYPNAPFQRALVCLSCLSGVNKDSHNRFLNFLSNRAITPHCLLELERVVKNKSMVATLNFQEFESKHLSKDVCYLATQTSVWIQENVMVWAKKNLLNTENMFIEIFCNKHLLLFIGLLGWHRCHQCCTYWKISIEFCPGVMKFEAKGVLTGSSYLRKLRQFLIDKLIKLIE